MPRCLISSLSCLVATLAPPSATAQKAPDTRIDHAPAGARAAKAQIAASGSTVYVTWEDDRSGLRNVYFNRSLDGGGTWSALDVQINTDTGALGSGDPDIAESGAAVFIVYNGNAGVRFNRSLDGGATWLPTDTLLAPLGSSFPVIAASGSTVYVVYRQTSAPPFRNDLFFRRSLDGGTTWQPAIRVDTDGPEAGDSIDQRLVTSGGAVYVAWRDLRNGLADVYFNGSTDGGATWMANDVRINTGVPAGTVDAFHNTELAASGSTVYVVWWDNRNAPGQIRRDIFVKRSLDQGVTWPVSPTRLDTDPPGAAESHYPHIAASGSSAWVVWSEFRNGLPDIYLNRTSDNGATWLAADVRVDQGPAGTSAGVTQIAAQGSTVYLTFQDDRNGSIALFLNRSLDGGVNWLPADLQLRTVPGVLTSTLQDIGVSGASVYVVWDDSRTGSCNVYFNIPFGFQPYGTGKPGSGGIPPRIDGAGQPVLGGTVSLDIVDGLGGAAAVLLIGGPGSKTSIPVLGGTLLVLPVLTLPIGLSGAAGVPGAGMFTLPIGIAPDPALIGAAVYFQPAVLDAGASFGLSIGNAVEMWIG